MSEGEPQREGHASSLEGRSAIRLQLDATREWMSRRRDGIHRAEALIAAGDWYAAVGPTLVAHNISRLCAPGLLDPSASQGTT